jgi:thiol-disulfide isomerase/thioredoxin
MQSSSSSGMYKQTMSRTNLTTLGGQPKSMYQKLIEVLTNWKYISFIIIALLLVLFGYYIYKQSTKTTAGFNANREHAPKGGSGGSKVANLMLFYVDWCPHCKTAKPEWENLKAEYEGKTINGYKIIFTEYNCTTESSETEELMNKYKIEGYPTIKLLKDNQIIEYDAKPTKATMEQFLNTVL